MKFKKGDRVVLKKTTPGDKIYKKGMTGVIKDLREIRGDIFLYLKFDNGIHSNGHYDWRFEKESITNWAKHMKDLE